MLQVEKTKSSGGIEDPTCCFASNMPAQRRRFLTILLGLIGGWVSMPLFPSDGIFAEEAEEIHQRSHRKGDIGKVMRNLQILSNMTQSTNSKMIVVVDYILYKYNKEGLLAARNFSKKLGFVFNVRIGNPQGLEKEVAGRPAPIPRGCEFPWKALTIDWNGDLLACCEHAIWTDSKRFGKYKIGETKISDIWQGLPRQIRRRLDQHGSVKAIEVDWGYQI